MACIAEKVVPKEFKPPMNKLSPKFIRILALLIIFTSHNIYSNNYEIGIGGTFAKPSIDVYTNGFSETIQFNTNNGPNWGLIGRYKSFKLETSPTLFGKEQFNSNHGPTSFYNLKLSNYEKYWGTDIYIQSFKGFYTDSTSIYRNIERPNLKLTNIIINTYFPIFKFSSVEQIEYGISKKGIKFNFLYLLSLSNKRLSTDSTLFITRNVLYESQLSQLRDLNTTELIIGLGAGVNIFVSGFFFDYTLFIGTGPQYRHSNIYVDDFKRALKIHMHANGGYTFKRIKLGFTQKFDMSAFDQDSEGLIFTTLSPTMYISYSF